MNKLLQLSWSEPEYKHLMLLDDMLKVDLFKDDFSEIEMNEFNDFIANWVTYAQEELMWSKAKIGNIGLTLNIPVERNQLSDIFISDYNVKSFNRPDCDCGMNDDWCGMKKWEKLL